MRTMLIKNFHEHLWKKTRMLLVFFFLATAVLASEQEKATISFKQAPVEAALKKIEVIYKVGFTYDPAIINGSSSVDLIKKERTLDEVLSEISGQTGLTFMKVGSLIGIKKTTVKPSPSFTENTRAADVTVKGKITDANGQPLANASIQVVGANKGTVTNETGTFVLSVPQGSTIRISMVGYTDQDIIVDRESDLSITLQPQNRNLEEVVVTALGVRKEKAKVAYAIQEVKGDVLQKAPESNVAANLTGKVAGLSIYNKSTLFETPEVYLRGQSTLIVIDGVPTQTDFWNINPNDIESVNVLKGTAASALYGSLGINGAIMITTKKGKGGANGLEVSYNTSNQFQAGFLVLPKTQTQYGMGWNGYYAFVDGKGGNGWYDDYGYVWGPKLNVKNESTESGYDEFPQYNSPYNADEWYPFTQQGYTDYSHYKPMPWVTRGQNNLKNFLNNEMSTSHNISLSGKSDRSDYRISVSHVYQKGQVPNTKLNSTTISLGGSLKITDKLKAEANVSYNKQYTPNYPVTGYGPNNYFYNILLWMGPDVDLNDLRDYWKPAGGRTSSSGAFIPYGVKNIQQSNYNYTWYNNPWFLAHEYLKGYTNDVVIAQANATYDFTKDLQLLVRTGLTTNSVFADTKTPYSYINYGTSAAPRGNYSINQNSNFLLVSDVLLTYKKTFFEDLSLTVSGGASNRFSQAKKFFCTHQWRSYYSQCV